MKNLTAAMVGYLQAGTQTFNTCWLITRQDATVFSFTDCDVPLVVGGVTYVPTDSYTPTANEGSNKLDVDNLEVLGFLDSAAITEADVAKGLWDYAAIRIFMVNRNDLSAGTYEMRAGWLGQIEMTAPSQFKAELRGLTQALQQNIGDIITPTCRYTLGDSRCTVNLAALQVSPVAVTTVYSTQEIGATSLTQADGYFAFGSLTWLTGANAGVTIDIQGYTQSGGIVLMQLPMAEAIVPGDTFSIRPGCQKRYDQDCVGKFANGVNFGGFKDLPGADKVMRPGGA